MVERIGSARLRKVITMVTGVDINSVGNNVSLFASGLLDSLNAIEVVEGLEKEFGFEFDTEELNDKNFYSIETIVDFINNRRTVRTVS